MPQLTPQKLDAFKGLASSQGFSEDEVSSFLTAAEAFSQPDETEDISGIISGIESGAINQDIFNTLPASTRQTIINQLGARAGQLTEPEPTFEQGLSEDVQRREAFGEADIRTEQKRKSIFAETEPDFLKQVFDQNGGNLLSGIKTLSAQKSMAESIIGFGGVAEFRRQAPLGVLLESNKELKEANSAAETLLSDVNAIQQDFPQGVDTQTDFFGKGNLTGPIAGKLPGFLSSDERIRARQNIGTLFTQRAKELSGVAINPEELKRMRDFLPSNTDQERTVAIKADQLDRTIRMNMQVREDALRSGRTIGEVWKEGKNGYFQAFGFSSRGGTKKQQATGVGSFTIESVE